MKGLIVLFVLVTGVICADPLNIFIIPHSHCDPGWLNTFEGYFRDQVSRILTGVTETLRADSTKKFVWAEISFFHLWYEQQAPEMREAIKTIVKSGQFEFVAGGWVQNDEANANFDIVIDQVTEGHDFLHRVFGVVPRVAWQIDPFGHSSITPSLFARMGFEALVINRIHYGVKANFKENKNMEFLWTGSRSLGNESEMFTHVLHTHYSAPKGFDWEEGNMHISSGNVASRAEELVRELKGRATAYRTNNLLVAFGDDFKFQNPTVQFSNMDQLIREINSKKDFNVKIQYGTVSEYLDSVKASAARNQIQFSTYNGDFFPYADNEDAYWTGYYTSRPVLKGHSRGTDSIIRAAEGLYALGRATAPMNSKTPELLDSVDWNSHFQGLRNARRNAALVQHHDGITGTAKNFVVEDYTERLDQARAASSRTITEMAQILLTNEETPSLSYDLKAFSFEKGDEEYVIVVHNPLGWIRRKYIKIAVTSPDVVVTSYEGVELVSQIVPLIDLNTYIPTTSRYELYFLIEVPPLGLQTYFLSKAKSKNSAPLPSEHFVYLKNIQGQNQDVNDLNEKADIEIENEHISVKFQGETGLMESVKNKDTDTKVELNQELIDYHTHKSGAYIMRTDTQQQIYNEQTSIKLIHIKGVLVSLVCTFFYERATDPDFQTSVCVKVFSTRGIASTPNILEVGGFMEVIYSVVGRSNRETVTRFNTNLKTKRAFYTDNGLEIRGRMGEGSRTENKYYPNLSFAYLLDESKDIQFTILSRQAMGTHSREEGMIEQMLHRALSQDDGRGLGEPNNDFSRVQVMVYMMVQPMEPSVRMARRLALALQHQPRVLYSEFQGGPKAWRAHYKLHYFPLESQLPHNVHLLSLKARDSVTDDCIIRFVHIYETGQHSTFSKAKEIRWDSIFRHFSVETKRERSLAMSMDADEAQARRPIFKSAGALDHVSGFSPRFIKLESQNTQEEGVFISNAALEDQAKQTSEPQTPPGSRNLLALSLTPNDVIIALEPMQIKSYFVQLVGKVAEKPTIPAKITKSAQRTTTGREKGEEDEDEDEDKPTKRSKRKEVGEPKTSEDVGENPPPDDVRPPTPPRVEVGSLETRAFLLISVLGTGLVILAYFRLRNRNRKLIGKRNKGLMEV